MFRVVNALMCPCFVNLWAMRTPYLNGINDPQGTGDVFQDHPLTSKRTDQATSVFVKWWHVSVDVRTVSTGDYIRCEWRIAVPPHMYKWWLLKNIIKAAKKTHILLLEVLNKFLPEMETKYSECVYHTNYSIKTALVALSVDQRWKWWITKLQQFKLKIWQWKINISMYPKHSQFWQNIVQVCKRSNLT